MASVDTPNVMLMRDNAKQLQAISIIFALAFPVTAGPKVSFQFRSSPKKRMNLNPSQTLYRLYCDSASVVSTTLHNTLLKSHCFHVNHPKRHIHINNMLDPGGEEEAEAKEGK